MIGWQLSAYFQGARRKVPPRRSARRPGSPRPAGQRHRALRQSDRIICRLPLGHLNGYGIFVGRVANSEF